MKMQADENQTMREITRVAAMREEMYYQDKLAQHQLIDELNYHADLYLRIIRFIYCTLFAIIGFNIIRAILS